jgi:integrase
MGVYQRSNGKWAYEIPTYPEGPDGKRKMVGKYDFRDQDTATLAWIEKKREIEKQTTYLTFLGACTNRLQHLDDYTVKDEYGKVSKSFANNRARLKRFIGWANLPLKDINREMVQKRLKELTQIEGISFANANKHLIALKAVFNHAINEGKLVANPCKGIREFPVEKQPKFIPEKEQIAQVLLRAEPMDRAYLVCIMYSAARVGEINSLVWPDVDFNRQAICLWTRKKKGSTKTPRWIPVIPKVLDALRYAYAHRVKNSPWVFTNPRMVVEYLNNPERWRYIYRDKFFKTLCRECGVPEMGYHSLRHRAASNMAAKGVPLSDIQRYLGHERATTTDLYLQSLGFTALAGAAAALDDSEDFNVHTDERTNGNFTIRVTN